MIGKVTFSDVRFSNFPIFQFFNFFKCSIFQFSAISYRKKSAYMGRRPEKANISHRNDFN